MDLYDVCEKLQEGSFGNCSLTKIRTKVSEPLLNHRQIEGVEWMKAAEQDFLKTLRFHFLILIISLMIDPHAVCMEQSSEKKGRPKKMKGKVGHPKLLHNTDEGYSYVEDLGSLIVLRGMLIRE
jgi:hypothetical protein